jgi:hypothetical protein
MAAPRSCPHQLHALPPQPRYTRKPATDDTPLGWTARVVPSLSWTQISKTTLVWMHVCLMSPDAPVHSHPTPNDRRGHNFERAAAAHSGALQKSSKNYRTGRLPRLELELEPINDLTKFIAESRAKTARSLLLPLLPSHFFAHIHLLLFQVLLHPTLASICIVAETKNRYQDYLALDGERALASWLSAHKRENGPQKHCCMAWDGVDVHRNSKRHILRLCQER